MFRGSSPAKIDVKGRLKIPTEHRRLLEEQYGPDVFMTSVRGDYVHIYPMAVWESLEERLLALPASDRLRDRFLERVNYFGQQVRLDAQGRALIPQILREAAEMSGEVVVAGRLDHLVVWNRSRFDEKLAAEPFTEEDFDALAERGI